MTTYLLLGVPFLAIAIGAVAWARRRTGGPGALVLGVSVGVLLVLTAVFDNVIVGVGLVGYDEAKILGLRLGVAPVEDFFYALAAGLLLPAVWWLLGGPRSGAELRGRSGQGSQEAR